MTRAFILGASGLVGKKLLIQLLQSTVFTKVTSIGRRSIDLSLQTDKLNQVIVDFDHLDAHRQVFADHDCLFICLGTTRADAGSAEAFYKIDHDYILNAAKIFKESNKENTHVLLLTSQGANKNSFLLYPRTKGENEADITALSYAHTSIFRPALLLLDQEDKRPKRRFGEELITNVFKVFGNPDIFTIRAFDVATAMRKVAENVLANGRNDSVRIYEQSDLKKLVA